MIIIGLTGNIATGKSTVASMFRDLGAMIIDADQIAREVVQEGKPAWHKILKHFGEKILNEDRSINRSALADIVFGNDRQRKILNDITHPEIMKEIRKLIRHYCRQGAEIVVIEAALIVEKGGMKDLIDKLVVVNSPEELQLKRLNARNSMPREKAVARIKSQMSAEEKMSYADYVIDNSGNLESTRDQVKEIMSELLESP